jgi:nucleoside-diphosphate-sugar epimerase
LAAILSAKGEQNPSLCWEVNIGGTLHVLDAAHESGVERVLIPTSIAVFGPESPRDHTPQDTIIRPRTMYGITKVTGELLGEYYGRWKDLDVRGVRYPGIISSETLPGGGTTDYAVEIFYAAVQRGRYECFVRADTTLPMMYMPDAIRAIMELADADRTCLHHPTSYNLAAMSFSAGELANAIRRHIPEFVCTYAPDHRQAIADGWPRSIDDRAARTDWGWKPAFDLDTLVADMLTKLRERMAAGRL